jgi:hypothetical protein
MISPSSPAASHFSIKDGLLMGGLRARPLGGAALFGDPAVKWAESPAVLPEEKEYRAA